MAVARDSSVNVPASSSRRVRTGLFEIDLTSGEVHKNGRRSPLQEQPFRVLAVLLEHPGEVVTREQLQARLWPADTYVGFDEGLNTAIRKLRLAFGDSADNPRFIETLPRRGYRFIAPVSEIPKNQAPGHADAMADVPTDVGNREAVREDFTGEGGQMRGSPGFTSQASSVRPRSRKLVISEAAAIVLILAGVTYLIRPRLFSNSSAPKRMMLAILPFQNLNNDQGQEYFSDGLTEETIADLGQLSPEHLGVIARTSAMAYKHTDKTISQIGRELGVDYILEGSVRREGGKARVSAQLVRVSDQTHVWAQNYDRELDDLLDIENELGKTIAQQVQVNLAPQRQIALSKFRTVDSETYDLYLKGRYYWNQRTQAGFWKGIEYFKQALERDPNYARAYAGLADCYILLGPSDALPATEVYPLAKAAALKALQLDDALAEAHASLGFVTLLYDWNPAEAEKEFRRAIELDPNYPTAHHWYAYDLSAMKRSDEAVAEIRHAVELDPLSSIINADAGQILYLARRSDEAIAQCQKTVGLDPQFIQVYWYLGVLYEQKGMFDQAFDAFSKAPGAPDSSQSAAIRAAYRMSGIKGYWQERLAMLEHQSKTHYVSPYTFAVSYALMSDRDRALENLEKAFDERYPSMVFVQIEPVFDNLRSDPRYTDLLRRIGLPQ